MQSISENGGQIPKVVKFPQILAFEIDEITCTDILAHMLSIARHAVLINFHSWTSIGHFWTKMWVIYAEHQ